MTDYLYELDLRPRFIDLWKKHRFRSNTLATMAEVPEETILAMFRGEAVSQEIAEKVFDSLPTMLNSKYTFYTLPFPAS